MNTHVVVENGNIVFEGRHQDCINYLTNNPDRDLEIETIEYIQRK